MPVLLCNGRPVCPLEVAISFEARSRGLLGRDGIDGALLLRPASSVHTFRMRFDLDVAFLDRDLVVLRTARMRRNRMSRPGWQAKAVLEAEAGAFASWGLVCGARLGIGDGDLPGPAAPGLPGPLPRT